MRKPNPKGEPMVSMHSIEGYKIDSPDKQNDINVIHSKHITMEEVPHDVIGKDNLGNTKLMKPGKNYTFPGDIVIEVPLKNK
jgi:hypothetical protein